MKAPCLSITFALLVSVAPAPLPAQAAPVGQSNSCVAAVPDEALHRVPIYLEAEPRDSAARLILPVADGLAQLVAFHVRTFLGAAPAELPAAEPHVTWRTLGGGILVHAERDGTISWTYPPPRRAENPEPTAGALLLERALTAVRDSGEKLFVPAEAPSPSATTLLAFRQPVVNRAGVQSPLTARHAVAAFSLAVPWEEPARMLRPPRIIYPERPRAANAQGTVILEFVVDTLGRAEANTVSEYWPEGRPQQTGDLGEYYRAFVGAARRGISGMRFEPASIAGCRVRQRVQLPFEFGLRQ